MDETGVKTDGAAAALAVRDGVVDAGGRLMLQSLYERYWTELCSYINKTFGAGPPEPEDVVQTAFARFAALKDPSSLQNPRAFLYATARNAVIDHHRASGRRAAHEADLAARAGEAGMSDPSAEDVLLGRERLRLFIAALDDMPPLRRRLVLLSRMEGLTCKEIAAREGMSPAAVQKQVARALAQCLNILEGDADHNRAASDE